MNIQTAQPVRPFTFGEFAARYGIVGVFAVLVAFVALLSDRFLSKQNIVNLFDQAAPVGLIAVGVTLCIVAGVFDLSTGAIFAVAAVAATKLAAVDPWLGVVAGVVVGAALGGVNAVVVLGTGVNSFIGTLSTAVMFRGVALIATGGQIVSVGDSRYRTLGTETLLDAQLSVWILVVVALVAGVFLSSTVPGRSIYAVGGNPAAARLVGIRVGSIKSLVLVVSGACAGLAGVISSSRTGSAQADIGIGLELSAITAVVVGGTSIFGGEGAIWRTVLGVMLIQTIGNAFNLLGVDPTYRQVTQGALILFAVTVDQLGRQPTSRQRRRRVS